MERADYNSLKEEIEKKLGNYVLASTCGYAKLSLVDLKDKDMHVVIALKIKDEAGVSYTIGRSVTDIREDRHMVIERLMEDIDRVSMGISLVNDLNESIKNMQNRSNNSKISVCHRYL